MKTEKLVQDSEWCWGRHEETQNRFPFLWIFHALSISFELSSFCGKWMLFVSDIFKQRTHNDFNSNFTDLSAPHRSFRTLHIEVLVVFAVSFRSNYVEWELRALEQCKKKNWMVKNRLESTNNNKKKERKLHGNNREQFFAYSFLYYSNRNIIFHLSRFFWGRPRKNGKVRWRQRVFEMRKGALKN